jgi:hypothetical protein
VARQIIGPKKPRKLTKPLKSTILSVRKRWKEIFGEIPPQDLVFEMALSEDQEIENWKAGLILVLDDTVTKKKKLPTAKKKSATRKKSKAKAAAPSKTKAKRSAR